MHCDEVFDILTRGPFPRGVQDDDQVEWHLAHCADCRRLAEALRPAIELFQEAVAPEETSDLPGYHGSAVATQPTWRLGHVGSFNDAGGMDLARLRHRAITIPWRYVGYFAASIVLGGSLAVLLRFGGMPGGRARDVGAFGQSAEAHMPFAAISPERAADTVVQTAALVRLHVPRTCLVSARPIAHETEPAAGPWPELRSPSVGAKAASQLLCCTACHAQGRSLSPSRAVANQIAQACRVCH